MCVNELMTVHDVHTFASHESFENSYVYRLQRQNGLNILSNILNTGALIKSPTRENNFSKNGNSDTSNKSQMKWRNLRVYGFKHSVTTRKSIDLKDMPVPNQLAINALELSAPASDILLKSRSSKWFQLSGHPNTLAPAGLGTVWKKRSCKDDVMERKAYEAISKDVELADIIPHYYREVEYQGEHFIELENLLHGFNDPYVMDIKMGTRTFLESEVNNMLLRPDLYRKMIAIDPEAPTEEERKTESITKLRYMQFREQQSTSYSHGFRIEAIKCRGLPPVTDLKTVNRAAEVSDTLEMFIKYAGNCQESTRLQECLLRRLKEMRAKIEKSDFFQRREVVGASLFIIFDDSKVGAWLIDFGKTNELSEDVTITHRLPWKPGNHEEGLLFGFDTLIKVIENLDFSRYKEADFSKHFPAVVVRS